MANKKISQLPVSALPLTGAELVPIVRAGVTSQTTVDAFVDLVPAAVFSPSDMPGTVRYLNSILNRGIWYGVAIDKFADYVNSEPQGSSAAFGTPSSALRLKQTARRQVQFVTQTGSDGVNFAQLYQSGGASLARRPSGAHTVTGGLTVYVRGGWEMGVSGNTTSCRFFMGMAATDLTAMNGSDGAFATLTNLVGIGKYDTDANVQWITNDAAGSITKTDMGVTFLSLEGHYLELYLYSDYQSESITALLRDLDSGVDYTHTFTTNLPAADTGLKFSSIFNNGFHQDSNNREMYAVLASVLINPGF